MIKWIFGFFPGIVLGVILGGGVMLIAFPYLFPPAPVNEAVASVESKRLLATGVFLDHAPEDPVHYGEGRVQIFQSPAGRYELFLAEDFLVRPGPAFHVYVSSAAAIRSNADFKRARTEHIGQLKSFTGSQVYTIPANIDFNEVRTVIVWCRRFGVLIATAPLKRL